MGQELLHFRKLISLSVENYLKLLQLILDSIVVFQKIVNLEVGDNL